MAIKSSRHDPEGLHPGRRHHWARSNGSGCGQFGALDDLTPRAWHCLREQVALNTSSRRRWLGGRIGR